MQEIKFVLFLHARMQKRVQGVKKIKKQENNAVTQGEAEDIFMLICMSPELGKTRGGEGGQWVKEK